MPEPPPRPARPSFADEVRRPAPLPAPSAATIRLAGFTPEPMPVRSRAEHRGEPARRASPAAQRTGNDATTAECRAGERRCRRRFARRATEAPPSAAARRRRRRPPPRSRTRIKISPRWRSGWRPRCAGRRRAKPESHRRSQPEPPPAAAAEPSRRRAASLRWPRRSRRAGPKTGFENLEDEMASLLGRPKRPS